MTAMKASPYSLYRPPGDKPAQFLTPAEADARFKWFLANKGYRISLLERLVRDSPGMSGWSADFDEDSLLSVGAWFRDNIETRPRTQAEKQRLHEKTPEWFSKVDSEEWELTERTLSIAIDLGIYLGEALLKHVDGASWQLPKTRKDNINHNQPMVIVPGREAANPVHLVVTLAYGIARGTKGSERLAELYSTWRAILGRG